MVDSSVLVSLWGVNDHNLCNWSLILRGWHFNFDVPNIFIPFREYVNDSFDSPVSTNRIGILHYDYLIHSHRILLSIPLLSWDQWRKHTSGLRSPEGVHYLLHQLDSMLGFLVSLNGPCGPVDEARLRSMSLEHIWAAIWVVGNSSRGALIHYAGHFQ